jgi:lia operon protein LiaG
MTRTYQIRKYVMKIAMIGVLLICAQVLFASGEAEGGTFYGIGSVEVDTDSLPFEFRGTSSNAVEVTIGRLRSNIDIDITQRGDTLIIDVDRRFNPFATGRSDPIIVTLPQETELEVSSASAGITVANISSDGVEIGTASGSINAESLEGEIQLKTASGSVRLENAAGDAEISTASGSITTHEFDGDLEVSTASGSIKVSEVTGLIQAKSTSGSIRIDNYRTTGDSTFESVSGSIEVDFNNPRGDLRFELRSTSGSLRVFGDRADRSLNSGDGRFLMKGKTVSGSQRYE